MSAVKALWSRIRGRRDPPSVTDDFRPQAFPYLVTIRFPARITLLVEAANSWEAEERAIAMYQAGDWPSCTLTYAREEGEVLSIDMKEDPHVGR